MKGQFQGLDNKGTEQTPVFPDSSGESLDKAGIDDSGYIDAKGTPDGLTAMFNYLPPGENIEDQKCADIRPMPFKTVTGLGYPGDGWSGK